jgi:hypothetical protein
MTDPMNEVLYGTPDLTPEEEQQLMLQAQQTEQDFAAMEAMANQPAMPQQPSPGQVQQTSQLAQPTGTEQQPQQEGNLDLGGLARQTLEGAFAVPAGLADFGVDLINLLPSKEVPGIDNPFRPGGKAQKLPKFQSDIMQSIREMVSIVVPTILITKRVGGGLSTAASASKLKMLQDPFVKWIAPKLLGAGVGAGVDYVAEPNQTDDNLSGTLKKNFPAQFGWIPDNVATLDGDSPDVKRMKNVVEGVGIGLGVDFVEGIAKLIKGRVGIKKTTQWIPENEKAASFLKANLDDDAADTVEEAIAKSAAKRSDSLDELGEYNFSKSQNLDEPMLGVHDLYGYNESGIRTVDDLGIVGAQVDVARIFSNADSSYGRVGSVVSEPALKFGLELPEGQDTIIRGLASQLKDAGEYGYTTASGRYLSFKEISAAGEQLADDFYGLSLPQLKEAVRKFQYIDPNTDTFVLKDEGYAAVFNTIKQYMSDYMDMDYMKAQALTGTSFAGQVSDMAQGMRLMAETPAVSRAQEQVLDRLEFLLAQKGMTSYTRGRALNMLNLWNRLTDVSSKAFGKGEATRTANAIADEKNKTLQSIERIKGEAKGTIDTLRAVKAERPEMLAPLMLAYEMTDGKVDSITKLNNYVRSSTGIISKALFDGDPDVPSAVLKGFWSNVYNSTLSAITTPLKAGLSNIALLAERPIAQAAGAVINGDMAAFRRGWYQYSAALDTLSNGFQYMNQVFKRSAADPYVMTLREDMGVAEEGQLEVLRVFANAKAERGEYGPQAMLSIIEETNDLASHPWLRFGQRGMQAFDGFTQAVIGNIEARGRAWDKVTYGGKAGFDTNKANELSKKVYSEMFDENDNITDSAVRYASGEISMSLDNAANDALSGLIRTAPIIKPFLLFTKTPINLVKFMGSHNPIGLFVDQMNAFGKPFNEMPLEKVQELLGSRGIEYSPETIQTSYNAVRNELKGRKAIGMLSVMGAASLFMNDSITGNGLYDKEKQRLRRDANWQPRSIRVPGGNWVSYDNIPGVSDWLALTADIMDNFTTLNSGELEENLRAAGFVLSATLTDKSMLAALEPLNDILSGNVGAINRWTSSFATSAATPGSSLLAEFGRLLMPAKKEVENNFFDLVANRNPLLKSDLPNKYDWIDGGLVGEPPNFWARVWNTYLPWKVSGSISPEKQFLMDIEYDARPSLRTNGRGVDYTNEERSEVTSLMGQQGDFKRAIQQIMQSKEGKAFRKEFKRAREQNLQPQLESFDGIHMMLDSGLRSSMRFAEASLSNRDGVMNKQFKNQTLENFLKVGDINGAEQFLKDFEQNFSY